MVRKFCVWSDVIISLSNNFLPTLDVSASFAFWDVSQTANAMHRISPRLGDDGDGADQCVAHMSLSI